LWQLLGIIESMLSTLGATLLSLLLALLWLLAWTSLLLTGASLLLALLLGRTALLLWLLHSHHLAVGTNHNIEVALAVEITLKGRGTVGVNQRWWLVGQLGCDSSAVANVANDRTGAGSLELATHASSRVGARCCGLALSSRLAFLLLLSSHHQSLLVLLFQQHELHLVVVQRVGVAVELARPCCATATGLLLSHLLGVENQPVAAHESRFHSFVAHG
jgi:hypothetical protein